MEYDIFISYRRNGGEHTAIAIRDRLTAKGYRVFLDVEALRAGPFNEALYQVIENCRDVLVILSPDSLDRCVNPDDWVRLEISHALEKGRNVIPVMTRDFRFPDTLPPDIDKLRFQNGLVASVDFFDAFIEKLTQFLESKPVKTKKTHRILAYAAGAVLAAALAVGAIFGFMGRGAPPAEYPSTQAEQNLVSEVISYAALNLSHADVAVDSYFDSLEACRQFLQDGSLDREGVSMQIFATVDTIENARKNLQQVSPTLSQNLDEAPFDKGDVMALPGAIEVLFTDMLDRLTYLETFYLDDPYVLPENKQKCLKLYIQMGELIPDYLFYNVNEMLLPVTDGDALVEFKTDMLPHMVTVYTGQHWVNDADELKGLIEQRFSKEERLINEIAMLVGEDQATADELQIRMQKLEQKRKLLEEKQQQLEEEKAKLEQLKQEAYEKFKPMETDDLTMLWAKGLRFIRLNMPEAAVTCFEMYSTRGTRTDKICGENAMRFVEQMPRTMVTGGCMVYAFEEGLPKQNLQIGDIIYAINDLPTMTAQAYIDQRNPEIRETLRVLRFRGDGEFDLLEVDLNPEGGRMMLYSLNEFVEEE